MRWKSLAIIRGKAVHGAATLGKDRQQVPGMLANLGGMKRQLATKWREDGPATRGKAQPNAARRARPCTVRWLAWLARPGSRRQAREKPGGLDCLGRSAKR
jgi:hypothetical protein